MKKTILIIFLLMLSDVVWAQKAPEGFCGLKWQSGKEELKKLLDPIIDHRTREERWAGGMRLDLIPEEDFNLDPNSVYFRAFNRGEWEKIGEARVAQYLFIFHENKFYKASVSFPKHLSLDIFLKSLTMKYGNPQTVTPVVLKINPNAKVGMKYGWVLEDKVGISLSYNDMENTAINGTLDYIYLPIWREINKMRDKDAFKTKDKL